MNTKRICGILALGILVLMSACTSQESKVKEVVKTFCEANQAQQPDKVATLYPEMKGAEAKTDQIDLEQLTVTPQDGGWQVEDNANHIFYVEESDGKLVIKDSRNVVEMQTKALGAETAAMVLGLIGNNPSDVEKVKAYTLLQPGSAFLEFLKRKHPEAFTYGVIVDNVQKKKAGEMGIYWLEAKATVKAGETKPLGPVTVYFVFKDKDGNVLTRNRTIADLSTTPSEVVETMLDLDDYPQAQDVTVELEPFAVKKGEDIDLLLVYGNLSKEDYQEYMNQH